MKPCFCGSGEPRRELKDGHGIFLTFACDKCERAKLGEFRPDIMSQYDADEEIDDPDADEEAEGHQDGEDAVRERDAEPLDPMRGVEFPFADNH